jgi:hypothetical protein
MAITTAAESESPEYVTKFEQESEMVEVQELLHSEMSFCLIHVSFLHSIEHCLP